MLKMNEVNKLRRCLDNLEGKAEIIDSVAVTCLRNCVNGKGEHPAYYWLVYLKQNMQTKNLRPTRKNITIYLLNKIDQKQRQFLKNGVTELKARTEYDEQNLKIRYFNSVSNIVEVNET